MSTEIAIIEGRFEAVKDERKREVEYKPSQLSLVRFYGGDKNGPMLQITVQQSDGDNAYVQLKRDQIKEMIAELKHAFELGT